VKKIAILTAFLFGSIYARASDPYSAYMHSVRQHQIAPGLKNFAEECGYTIEGNRPLYGVNLNDKWKRTKDPTRSSPDEATDFFSTAEIWLQNGKSRIVNIWSIGGGELHLMYCLDTESRVRFIESSYVMIPDDPSVVGWVYERRFSVNATEKLTLVRSAFRNLQGQRIAIPKMAPEDKKSLHEMPDIKLPAQVIAAVVPSRR